KDGFRAEQLPQWSVVSAYFTQKALYALMKSYILKKPRHLLGTVPFTNAKKFLRSIKVVRNSVAAVGAVGSLSLGPYALAAIIYELALWTLSEILINTIE